MAIIPPSAPPRCTFQNGNPQFHPTPAPRPRFAMTPLGALQALGARCTRAEILTYTALELHANKDTGFCNPGRETLAVITGLPENRISKATTSLEKKGFIRKEQPDPFHVHYYILTPPETEPVEPRARFRPPVRMQPVEPVPPMEPTPAAPAPETSATSGMNPCHQRNELVPPAAPLTDQWTDQKEKREATAEPARPEPAAASVPPTGAHSDFVIQTKNVLPDDWQLPPDYRAWAEQHRPDLADRLDGIASNFHDFHLSKATRSASWIAEWRRWINRERAVKPHQNASTAPPAVNRYAHLDLPMKPLDAAVQATYARSEQDRIDLLIRNGIDPATGWKIEPAAAAARTPVEPPMSTPIQPGQTFNASVETRPMTPAEECADFEAKRRIALAQLAALQARKQATPIDPPINDQADQSYEARLAALEARIAARKAREAAEREAGA